MKTVIYVNGTERFPDRQRLGGLMEYSMQKGWNLQSVEALQSPRQVKELIRIWNPGGFVVSRGAALNTLPLKCFEGRPVLFSHYPSPSESAEINCVFNDARATVELAVKELLSLNMSEYAFVGWLKPTGWGTARKEAFQSLMALHDKATHVFEPFKYACSSGNLTSKLAAWLAALPHPLGVLAANDQIAGRIVSACNLAHLSMPDDVAVIGIDNDEEFCEGTHPSLSSIDLGLAACGRLAGEMLDRLMSAPHAAPVHVTYPPLRLVRRESSRRFARHDPLVAQAVERIRREACSGLTAQDIVKEFPCSRRMAEIRFRNILGRSILQEIRRVRLETAQHLLRTTKLGLNFIANSCGYGSLSAFSIFFHQETGVSPSAWRANGYSQPDA